VDYPSYDGFAETLDSGFNDLDIESFLEGSQERSRELLENELKRIEQELENRDKIHEENTSELESKLDWYLDRLRTTYNTFHGAGEDVDELKEKIEVLYKDIRHEKRNRWRDRRELERERRELLKEIEELDEDPISDLL
jgi:chromosome segregation ATPase